MFFHIDESGNSGNNLFDPNQGVLSYGVLSAKTNVDVLATAQHAAILRVIGAKSIHAKELRLDGLRAIAPNLLAIQDKFRFEFDFYFVEKRSFAVVMFFDAVFDAGLNKAMKWDWYWTPLRFPLIGVLNEVLDDALLKEAWELKLLSREKAASADSRVKTLLEEVLARVERASVDKRLKEVVGDALRFGIQNPGTLDFGTDQPKIFSPNVVCFQFVLSAVANRQKKAKRKALGITVDRQSEFNPAQLTTYMTRSQISEAMRLNSRDRQLYLSHPVHEGVREDAQALISHFPEKTVVFAKSEDSIGLQLVDVYLWLANRLVRDGELPVELHPLAALLFKAGRIDGISVAMMKGRWEAFEKKLPQMHEIDPTLWVKHEKSVEAHRARIRELGLT